MALCKLLLLLILSYLEYEAILLESFGVLHAGIHICPYSSLVLGNKQKTMLQTVMK